MTEATGRRIATAALLIAGGNILSRLLGLVREPVIAALFGVGGTVDALEIATRIPQFMHELVIGGAVSGALIPVFSQLAGNDQALRRTFSTVIATVIAIAGVATAALEIIEDLPDVEVMLLPMGGGTGTSGACIVAKAINPEIQVVAVQSESAPAGYLSWKEGRIVEAEMDTFAEGLATVSGYELPQSIMAELLDDLLLVSDDDIRHAIGLLVEKSHTLAEGAGAAALAAAVKHPDRLRGKKVSITVSGANITAGNLATALKVYSDRAI